MKSQEILNIEYDKIMIDFKQKAFIEASLHHENDIETFVYKTYRAFSEHFNKEYQHIYLKPLNSLFDHYNYDSDNRQSFLTVSKQLPSTFWNTQLGEKVALEQSTLATNALFVLPLTEQRKEFFLHNNKSDFSTIKELGNTDKIKIQENFSEFIESFINTSVLPHDVKLECFHNFLANLETIAGHSIENNNLVNFYKDTDFINEVLHSVKLNTQFDSFKANLHFVPKQQFNDHYRISI